MTDSAAMVATDNEVVNSKVPVPRKFYDIKMKRYFVQAIDKLITSGRSRCTACAYAGLVPLSYHR